MKNMKCHYLFVMRTKCVTCNNTSQHNSRIYLLNTDKLKSYKWHLHVCMRISSMIHLLIYCYSAMFRHYFQLLFLSNSLLKAKGVD